MKMLANHLVNNSTNKLDWWPTVEKIVSTPIYILVRPIIWASVWNLIGVPVWVYILDSIEEFTNENAWN